jgi:hypothetical protein
MVKANSIEELEDENEKLREGLEHYRQRWT